METHYTLKSFHLNKNDLTLQFEFLHDDYYNLIYKLYNVENPDIEKHLENVIQSSKHPHFISWNFEVINEKKFKIYSVEEALIDIDLITDDIPNFDEIDIIANSIEQSQTPFDISDWKDKYFEEKKFSLKRLQSILDNQKQKEVKNVNFFDSYYTEKIDNDFKNYNISFIKSIEKLKTLTVFEFIFKKDEIIEKILNENKISRLSYKIISDFREFYRLKK